MNDGSNSLLVPLRFGEIEVLVAATSVTPVGSQPTSTADDLVATYGRAEAAILQVASSVAGTINELKSQASSPKEVQIEFGISVSVEGNIFVARGKTEATLAVTLTYRSS